MKYIYSAILVILGAGTFLKAQVNIGTGSLNTNSNGDSVLLEFNNAEKKGIILPWVVGVSHANLVDNTATPNGTFVLDRSDKKVKVKINGLWQDLNYLASTTNAIPVNTSLSSNVEKSTAQVVMGASSSTANGILVLESTSKALVLPKFKDVQKSIANPAPGMMAFDDTPGKEQLCVYNGTEWSFWTWK
ncbi:hypothetical protein [Riemerella anatipestifer]|uniref:Uncharacterized protein n=1 Tax=Riemerella anatipestifer TaxID=34085 RepID=A0AAP3AP19_RIEAN|nr:hypothetical protein [Riemerella anatipestifer]MCE3025199.1 hypothetical protein [Riemerella anatipestifer]MCO7319062.1 hypothetical protein [Riemerella anatipestifer]MCQ4155120.1 hypothetical protein [Riemerella anatipestifer]MCQ4181092.1 hypothetical protein [Riemerella anatipestifer]MCU7542932.1 hypothetical protein [Riemerella anatipestifer]